MRQFDMMSVRESRVGATLSTLQRSMQAMRDAEQIRSFQQLEQLYTEGIDYQVEQRTGRHGVLIAAWHGGTMEAGSDLLADSIAGELFGYYAFKATRPHSGDSEHPLHVTSIRFDDPRLIQQARSSEFVLSIHCCGTAPGVDRVFLGGGASDLIKEGLIEHLLSQGYNAGTDKLFPGLHPKNPCNLGKKCGIQMEIPQHFMDRLLREQDKFQHLVSIVQTFLYESLLS